MVDRPRSLRAQLTRLLWLITQIRPSVTAADVRRWLRWADPWLVVVATLAEPVALGLLVLTGLLLPLLGGDWAPVPTVRTLHGLAGLVIVLVLLHRIVSYGIAYALAAGRWVMRREGVALRRPKLPLSVGWRRGRDIALEVLYQIVLVILALTGIEAAMVVRTGEPLLGLFRAADVLALHSVAAPYFYAVLLLLSYVEGRKRARALLQELRSP